MDDSSREPGPDTGSDTADEASADPNTIIPEILARLSGVEELAGALFEELQAYPAGGPWLWSGLDTAKRAELWIELDGFVGWLQNTILRHSSNPDKWILPCWYRHPYAVESLTALMVAHQAAYHPKTKKPSFALVDWFTRALWPVIDSFKERRLFDACRDAQKHTDPSSSGPVLSLSADVFLEFVAADVETRTDA